MKDLVIVSGSRYATDLSRAVHVLSQELEGWTTPARLIVRHGACGWNKNAPDAWQDWNLRGVDKAAHLFAQAFGVEVDPWPADWSRGGQAGPERNRAMIVDALRRIGEGGRVRGFAFPDFRRQEQRTGTSNFVREWKSWLPADTLKVTYVEP